MRKLTILKSIIDIAFIFLVIGALTILIFVPMYLFGTDGEIPITIGGQEITASDSSTKMIIALAAIGALLFIYAIYLLRQILFYFMKKDIFNLKVVYNFNLIGKYLIISSLLTNIPLFVYNVATRTHLSIRFNGGGFDSLLLSISLGLFFMILSEVFKIAKTMKEENDLMI